jgi:hypothetical protein
MTIDRRRFLFGSLAASVAAACGSRNEPAVVTASAPASWLAAAAVTGKDVELPCEPPGSGGQSW